MNAMPRPVMRYHGGKFRLASRIIPALPPHRSYVEPFGGAASILLNKPRSASEVYNDKWSAAVTVFRVLRDRIKSKLLEEALRLTPFARDEFEMTSANYLDGLDDVELARRMIFRSFAGFGSNSANPNHSTGFRVNSTRTTPPARDWVRYPDALPLFTERLLGVGIENRDAKDVMAQHDTVETLHYVDCPYVHSTRKQGNRYCSKGYVHEMIDEDHRSLAIFLRGLRGMVVLSGYHSPLYNELFGDWHAVELDAYADGAVERTEVLWFNPLAWERRRLPLERAS